MEKYDGIDFGLNGRGASMPTGCLPVAYWARGSISERVFYGISKNRAFQRALAWGRDHKADPR